MIVNALARDYGIEPVCSMMGVSRSGYYKWLNRKNSGAQSRRDVSRAQMVSLVTEIHQNHSTHGYRWTAAFIRINHGIATSDNFIYKCFRFLGIKSETKHQIKYKKREIKDKYPNLIFSTWETVDRPRQVIVSDMTVFRFQWFYFEVTFYFDVFTKEIMSHQVAERRGHRNQYINGLIEVRDLLKGVTEPVVLHTDQGSVYASMAYNDLIKDTVLVRSMSRAGKPTDNPVNEALNGWIKEELTIDFHIESCRTREAFVEKLDLYVKYYNTQRPCWALDYDTPENYRKRFYKGELPKRDTFAKRELTPEPKFVKKRKEAKSGEEDKKLKL